MPSSRQNRHTSGGGGNNITIMDSKNNKQQVDSSQILGKLFEGVQIAPRTLDSHRIIPAMSCCQISLDLTGLIIMILHSLYMDNGLWIWSLIMFFLICAVTSSYVIDACQKDRISEHYWNRNVEYLPLIHLTLKFISIIVFLSVSLFNCSNIYIVDVILSVDSSFVLCFLLLVIILLISLWSTVCTIRQHRISGSVILEKIDHSV